jgi:hypothetical protein
MGSNENNFAVIHKKKARGSHKVELTVGQQLMYVLAKSFELTRLMNLEYQGSGALNGSREHCNLSL